jgi:tetratricopeptide (TPR) repeat protein
VVALLLTWAVLSPGAPLPEGGPALLKAAREARRAGKLDEAEKRLKEYDALKGDPEAARLEWLLLRAQRGETAAQKALHDILKKKGTDPGLVCEALARGYAADYRYDEAFSALGKWLEREPKSADALSLRGQLRSARAMPDSKGWGWGMMGMVDPEGAEADYRRVLELQPDNRDAQLGLAEVLTETQRYKEAADLFKRLHEGRKDDPLPALGLARCRFNLGEIEEAEKLLDALLDRRQKPGDALLAERARIALALGQPEKGEALSRKALAANPHNQLAAYQLAIALSQLGKTREAKEQTDRNKRTEKAVERLGELLPQVVKSPEDAKPRYEVGVVFAHLGQDDEAVRWWKGAVREKPDYAPAHRALADYYEKAGQKALAEQHRKLAGGK